MDQMTGYRAGFFDGDAEIGWLRHGWRGLRLFGRRAQAAHEAGDLAAKAEFIARADRLLTLMTGVLQTEREAPLGNTLLRVYDALRLNLFRANTENDMDALRDFELALSRLDHDMIKSSESQSVP